MSADKGHHGPGINGGADENDRQHQQGNRDKPGVDAVALGRSTGKGRSTTVRPNQRSPREQGCDDRRQEAVEQHGQPSLELAKLAPPVVLDREFGARAESQEKDEHDTSQNGKSNL